MSIPIHDPPNGGGSYWEAGVEQDESQAEIDMSFQQSFSLLFQLGNIPFQRLLSTGYHLNFTLTWCSLAKATRVQSKQQVHKEGVNLPPGLHLHKVPACKSHLKG